MKSLKEDYFNPFFSHIYVESSVLGHARTQEILAKFPAAEVIVIRHYKDVFCRSRQNRALQHRAQNLILAAGTGTLLYEGAPVCQSFGNPHFYYTSCAMNCIYDCSYCYLKGMYPSANIVVFVNLEDLFAGVERILKRHPLYLCVSYNTDLPALERITGYVREWCAFAAGHADLKIEIRTKCADRLVYGGICPAPNVIHAFTLSPQAVIDACERHTPSLSARLSCAAELIRAGHQVRLCFDPLICLPGWKRHYGEMAEQVLRVIDPGKLADISIGSFRIARDYLKNMRKQAPDCAVIWFPFQTENGYCHYPDGLMEEMEGFLTACFTERISEEKIFRWRE